MDYTVQEIDQKVGTVTISMDGFPQVIHNAPIADGMDAVVDFLDEYTVRYFAAVAPALPPDLAPLIGASRDVPAPVEVPVDAAE